MSDQEKFQFRQMGNALQAYVYHHTGNILPLDTFYDAVNSGNRTLAISLHQQAHDAMVNYVNARPLR